MFVLVAHGLEPRQRWREVLTQGRSYVLGRDAESDLRISWDPHVSRRHAQLTAKDDRLSVEKLPTAQNAIYFNGQVAEQFSLKDGERFVIGATTFSFEQTVEIAASPSAGPVEEMTFDRQDLKKVRFRDADRRFDVLTRLHEVIWGARTESELHERLTSLILAGVGNAEAVAIVEADNRGQPKTLHWERRREAEGSFHPRRA